MSGEPVSAELRQVLRDLGSPREALALFTQALARSSAGVVADYALLARPWNVPVDEITHTVHCWHGTADTLVPLSHTQTLVERLSRAYVTTWPDEGHLGLITHIGEVLDHIANADAA